MSFLSKRGNDALNVNPFTVNGQTVAEHITTRGSDWYWTVCAIMTVSTLVFAGLSTRVPRTHRVFHYITAAITLVAAIAYFSMASNLGWTPIDVEFQRSNPKVAGVNRQIFYVRYIDWTITTPLLLLDLLLTAAVPWPTIAFVILLDEVMIVTGLVGALVRSSYKWGYFVFGCAALVYVLYVLIFEARRNAHNLGSDVHKVYISCGVVTAFVWTLYPIAWGLCEGGNVISSDSEAVFYGILDVIAKPVFGFLLIFGHKNIDPARLGVVIRDYANPGEAGRGVHRDEKHHHNGTHNGVNNGVTNGTNGVTNGHSTVADTTHTTTAPTTTV